MTNPYTIFLPQSHPHSRLARVLAKGTTSTCTGIANARTLLQEAIDCGDLAEVTEPTNVVVTIGSPATTVSPAMISPFIFTVEPPKPTKPIIMD